MTTAVEPPETLVGKPVRRIEDASLLTGENNMVRAGQAVRKLGPKFVILKKGEHGAMLFSADGIFVVPAFPTADERTTSGHKTG